MSAGRKIDDEREARVCLKAAKAAGGDVGRWAREHGVDGRSLNAWRMNLARRSGEASPSSKRSSRRRTASVQLVEIVPAPAARTQVRYVVRVGGVELEVGEDFHEEMLVRLVRALRSC